MTKNEKSFCLCNSNLIFNIKNNINTKLPKEVTPKKGLIAISKLNFLTFYGHGTETEMIGQDRKAIIDLKNIHLLKGWVVYAMACNTAKVLGPAVIKVGGLSYIGYNNHFKFIPSTHEDFGKCVNTIPLELAKGRSTGEAFQSGKDTFDYYIEKYKKLYNEERDVDIKNIYMKTFEHLIHDKNSLVLLGNSRVTINYNIFRYW